MADLVTLQPVKEYLGLEETDDTHDSLLKNFIKRVSAAARSYCGRNFDQQTYTSEVYDSRTNGNGRNILFLKQCPVVSITSIADNGRVLSPADYVVDKSLGIFRLINGAVFSPIDFAISVTYIAGFTSVPDDLAGALVEWAAIKFKNKDRIGVTSQSFGSENIQYSVDAIPKEVKPVLDEYKSMRIFG